MNIHSTATHQSPYYIEVRCSWNPGEAVSVRAMIDSGAMGNFSDRGFAAEQRVLLLAKPQEEDVLAVDGTTLTSGKVLMQTAPMEVWIGKHHETTVIDVIECPYFPLILGVP